jgi:hypothetical protein
MEKEFIPYEQALALKELGFDEPCFGYFYTEDKFFETKIKNSELEEDCSISAPLYQQAFSWFRQKYGYFTSPTESDDDTFKKYDWLITKNLGEGKMFIKFIGYKDTYEEAELACLIKLIEIVKENK